MYVFEEQNVIWLQLDGGDCHNDLTHRLMVVQSLFYPSGDRTAPTEVGKEEGSG